LYRHYTRRTKSDHQALFVVAGIRSLKHPKWVLLKLCSANLGGRFDQDDMLMICEEKPDIIAVQEAGDQGWIISFLKRHGYKLVDQPVQPGQASTLTFRGPRVKVLNADWVQLLDGGYNLGPGSGPDESKAKWWNRNTLECEGVRFGASSWHATSGQGSDRRFGAAKKEGGTWSHIICGLRRPMFVIGDTNSDTDERFTAWLLDHGVTSDQKVLGRINTHEIRAIDAVYTQKDLLVA
jgi:hypothetical protein